MTQAQAKHPGQLLSEMLGETSLSVMDLAKMAEIRPNTLAEIIAGRQSVTYEIAEKLQQVLPAPKRFWIQAQAAYDGQEPGTLSFEGLDFGSPGSDFGGDPARVPGPLGGGGYPGMGKNFWDAVPVDY